MTHAIPADTINVTVNLPKAEAAELGRLAFGQDRSRGGLIKKLLLQALEVEAPDAAARIREIRRQRKAALLLAVGLFSLLPAFRDEDVARLKGQGRAQQTQTIKVAKAGGWKDFA